ncbi:angiogenic factor with G patch and FHA domains 1 isoform X1 [Euwallacea fornicatus]|uniref:angiogenic factor with G patch and FHA domains 1 isoform X1 n=1 Tax=Euwallacea fornicatus TaxID=995702 RepID=UPI00338EE019
MDSKRSRNRQSRSSEGKKRSHHRRRKSSSHSRDGSPSEKSMLKNIELDLDLKEKLNDLPEVLKFIERLQKIIEKQVKKVIKWKNKVKQLQEKKSKHVFTQTDSDVFAKDTVGNNHLLSESGLGNEKSLVDDIREAAEQAVQNSGFVYDEASGLYYDSNSGYYYNSETRLYYDTSSGIYFNYNHTTQCYEYNCQVDPSSVLLRGAELEEKGTSSKLKRKPHKYEKKSSKECKKRRKYDHLTVDLEEGECSDGASTNCDDGSLSESSDLTKQWPPCMRMIVETTEIPTIKPGTLSIITCDGGTVGREGAAHSICLPDINVSKHHLRISYDSDSSKYLVVDLGSRNGTLLNGKRISSSKQESEPTEVPHGSKLQLGSTILLCHIHEGTQTCGHCEPGLLLEEEKGPLVLVGNNRKNLNQQFKSELKRLKKQHGLVGLTDDSVKLAEGYTDRAERRRVEVGSQNPYEKTESASLEGSIPSQNKGFKLLAKMGWKEGQSLGKDGTTGVKEPIKVTSNVGTAGIGAVGNVTIPQVSSNSAKQSIWKKTQERFEKLPNKNVNIFSDEESDS